LVLSWAAEAYCHLERWMEYRMECGENIDEGSWVMRQLWNTKQGYYHHGTIKEAAKLKSSGVKRLIEDALWTQGIRKKSNLKRNRYEFQTDHGLTRFFMISFNCLSSYGLEEEIEKEE
jgi:hypothetical protein